MSNPRYILFTRDMYHSFFGMKTTLTATYGVIEWGTRLTVPFILLAMGRGIVQFSNMLLLV